MLGKQKAKVGEFNTKSRDGIKSELKYLQKSGEILENRKVDILLANQMRT